MRKILLATLGACAVLFAAAAPASAAEPSAAAQPSIIGGGNATETYSFMVALDNGCGGSLVSSQWIVTAHHCGGASQGRIGSTDINSGGEVGRIDKVTTNPGTDLTMMHLTRPVKATPVPLAQSNPAAGTKARLLGWGCVSWPNCQTPSTLKQIDLSVLASSRCAAGGGGSGDVCISGDRAHSACHGDSGGPAVVGSSGRWTLVGETHGPGDNGPECGTTTLYTGIAQYLTWINQRIAS
ncbi:trypsin-like serine protease [Amycolatopsis sp. PS_44_ISF1]|uniref:S1 family peptidase n=1 Tax=Amycolatopsis sp. PS_44_ISF1 TaxID=2974917 RepID=UPI0028DE785C|nr:trypsin-like serine protease [Amycolatopsis sp. PS_44_ISF1]MDT8913039.1 trypsin-like serine protease [Amycolatopsis sp. PS_44_ISF1]